MKSRRKFLLVWGSVSLACVLSIWIASPVSSFAQPTHYSPTQSASLANQADGWTSDAEKVLPSVEQRFAQLSNDERPDFQKHVIPLLGRLGCNGRACHGAFSGQGGFQLSLFGYDFEADHAAITNADAARIDLSDPAYSLILDKPTDDASHEGGKRFDAGGWEFNLLLRWIENGALPRTPLHQLVKLHVEPAELNFDKGLQPVALQVVAEWEDGSREDVTPLCRFQSNDEQFATITSQGVVQPGEPGDTHVVVFYDRAVVPVPVLQPVSEQFGDAFPVGSASMPIDQHVNSKLRKLGIIPSQRADDATFLRRVYLDVTGTLPTPDEVQHFLGDEDPEKRSKVIDELLESPAYAAWWTTKLCDFTGNNSEQLQNVLPVRGRASKDWYDWIFQRVVSNTPYDELVAGIVTASSRSPGQSYREYSRQMSELYRDETPHGFADLPSMPFYWARRDFRDVENRAINFAYAFMGVRIQCAQCHKHPFDQWTKQDFEQFTQFFSRVTLDANGRSSDDKDEYDAILAELGVEGRPNQLRREFAKLIGEGKTVPFPQVVVTSPSRRGSRGRSRNAQPTAARLLNGPAIDIDEQEDPREAVMDWLREDDNPYLSTAFVNRVWAHYFGRGIIHPPDDVSLANPPSNEPLLTYLAESFRDHDYDMRWLHRVILNSDAYQRSWVTNETNARDETNFSHALPRQLPAEVIVDVMRQATANTTANDSFLTELNGRAIAIPGTTVGRPGRNNAAYALQVFGRSTRESSCDCDRAQEASLLQTIYRQNDREILEHLADEDGWIEEAVKTFRLAPERVNRLQNNIAKTQRQLQNTARRLQALPQGDRKRATFKERRDQLRSELTAMKEALQELQLQSEPSLEEKQRLIELSYLRSLSRYPQDEELHRATQFLEESESLSTGLQGLLWALLNTKEFVVNH